MQCILTAVFGVCFVHMLHDMHAAQRLVPVTDLGTSYSHIKLFSGLGLILHLVQKELAASPAHS